LLLNMPDFQRAIRVNKSNHIVQRCHGRVPSRKKRYNFLFF
jgi:hypothetical protein